MKFTDLNLIAPILQALHEEQYEEPTPIQAQAIPYALAGHDVLGTAQTGTGKTAAFAVPMLQYLHETDPTQGGKPAIRGLVLTPTRELATQIGDSIKAYGRHLRIYHTVIFGGVKQGKQVDRLARGVHILVATPGRLLDLIDQGIIDLGKVEFFVLDEADRMLDMGFIHDVRRILKMLPRQRQTLFFSATMPNDIKQLSDQILNRPKLVQVDPVSSTAETVSQRLYYTNKDDKLSVLLHILDEEDIDQVLLFARTKRGADRLARKLQQNRIKAVALHGDKAQRQRERALEDFKERQIRVLVATDIAARGIDIDKLRYVINYDVPNVAETYVHRIGRSGRAGESGHAISISEPEENAYVRDIEKLTRQQIPVVKNHPYPQTDKPMTAAERKEYNKEKQLRKQEFFANRRKNR